MTKEELSARIEALFGASAIDTKLLDAHFVPEVSEGNTFEAALLRAQEGYPELMLQGPMAGVLPTTKSDYSGSVYGLQVAPDAAKGKLWLWQHDEPFSWGRGAASLAQLETMLQLLERYEEADLEDLVVDDEVDLAQLREKRTVGERLALIEDEDLRERLSPIVEDWAKLGAGAAAPASYDFAGLQETLEFFVPVEESKPAPPYGPDRFTWITASLVGDAHYVAHAPTDERAFKAFEEALARPDLADDLPAAFYWLFWSFLLGEDERNATLCDTLSRSPARLLQDAAALVAELHGGRRTVGAVDLDTLREAFAEQRDKARAAQAQAGDAAAMRAQVRLLDLAALRDWPGGLAQYASLERLEITAWNVPASIKDLKQLKWLKVLGPVPTEINELEHLEELSCGGLPASVAGLGKLRRLDLRVAQGSLPDDLAALESLEELRISSEHSKITLPDDIGALKTLRKLTLAARPQDKGRFVLCESLASLEALEELHLGGAFSKFPKDWSGATSLRHMTIGQGNSLKNVSKLAKVPALTSLRYIEGDNPPKGIEKLRRIEALELHLSASGEAPETVATVVALPKLRRLELTSKGAAAGLRVLDKLEMLELAVRTEDIANLAETLTALEALKELTLICFGEADETSRGNADGKVFRNIEALDIGKFEPATDLFPNFEAVPNLRRLVFKAASSFVAKTLPPGLSRCTKLREAILGQCTLEPGVLDGLETLRELERLEMPSTLLSELPDTMGQLDQLKVLALFGDAIESLPEWVGELPLEELNIAFLPTRKLPTSFAQMKGLKKLLISAKELDLAGALPIIAELPALAELTLHELQSEGIPEQLYAFGKLKNLDLRVCQFGTGLGALRMRLPETLVIERQNWF